MKKIFFSIFVCIIFSVSVSSQETSYNTSIQNVDFYYNGSKIIITFDLINEHPQMLFDIMAHPKFSNGNDIFSEQQKNDEDSLFSTFGGSLMQLKGGKHRIEWDFRQDSIEINDDIYIQLIGVASTATNLTRGSLMHIENKSPVKYLNTFGKFDAPALRFMDKSIRFVDKNKNDSIDAGEECRLEFVIENYGEGTAQNVTVNLSETSENGMMFNHQQILGNVEAGNSLLVRFKLLAPPDIANKNAGFRISAEDATGFMMRPVEITLPVKGKPALDIEIAQYSLIATGGGSPQKGMPLTMELTVKNVGKERANKVLLQIQMPNKVLPIGLDTYELGDFLAGESKTVKFEFEVNKQYNLKSVLLTAVFYNEVNKISTIELKIDE